MRGFAFHLAGLCCLVTRIVVGQETPVLAEPHSYQLKQDHSYRYDFELSSGEDGDGFLQLEGSVSYSLIPNTGRRSLIDEAFNDADAKDSKAVGKPLELRFHGLVHVKKDAPRFVDGTIRVAPRGDSYMLQGDSDFSLVSTSIGSMAFDELPPAGQVKWQSTRTREVVFVDEDDARLQQRFPMLRYGRYAPLHPGSPLFQRKTINHMGIQEKIEYELAELTDEYAVVKSKLVSSWISIISDKKAIEFEGTGQYTFDRAQRVISKGRAQNELKVTADGIEAKLPFKMAFVLREVVTAEELKQRRAKEEAQREAETAQRIASAIAVIKETSSEQAAVRDALQSLSHLRNKPTAAQRDEVSTLLNKYFKSDDDMTRWAAVRAAEEWATAENIPALLELLKTEQTFRRGSVMKALGATGGNAKVAAVMVRLMETPGTRHHARQALEAMGPVAEPAVIPLLKSDDRSTRSDACQILGEIGGKKSKVALEALVARSKKNDLEQIYAKMALDKIKQRLAADLD